MFVRDLFCTIFGFSVILKVTRDDDSILQIAFQAIEYKFPNNQSTNLTGHVSITLIYKWPFARVWLYVTVHSERPYVGPDYVVDRYVKELHKLSAI